MWKKMSVVSTPVVSTQAEKYTELPRDLIVECVRVREREPSMHLEPLYRDIRPRSSREIAPAHTGKWF